MAEKSVVYGKFARPTFCAFIRVVCAKKVPLAGSVLQHAISCWRSQKRVRAIGGDQGREEISTPLEIARQTRHQSFFAVFATVNISSSRSRFGGNKTSPKTPDSFESSLDSHSSLATLFSLFLPASGKCDLGPILIPKCNSLVFSTRIWRKI